MQKELLTKKAKYFFDNKNYAKSLRLYEQAGDMMGRDLFGFNISLCENKIVKSNNFVSLSGYVSDIFLNGFSDAENIIYADIDLNTIDGSSIWFSSMISILSQKQKTIVISKSNINNNKVIENIVNKDNCYILTPSDIEDCLQKLSVESAVNVARELDAALRNIKRVVVRGVTAASMIAGDRQFNKRLYAYLTDIYTHEDNCVKIKDGIGNVLDPIIRQCAAVLVQTDEIESLLKDLVKFEFETIKIPPPVNDALINIPSSIYKKGNPIKIGYAGKIAPQWGILELIDWVDNAREKGVNIELHVIGNKISGCKTAEENKRFSEKINKGLDRVSAIRWGGLNRHEVANIMKDMQFSWCWRPAYFEENTLELSTKLVEGIVAGQRCIVFPSEINKKLLGKDYDYFTKSFDDFFGIISSGNFEINENLRTEVLEKHSISIISKEFYSKHSTCEEKKEHTICFATHDPKFIYPYYSKLKKMGFKAIIDRWEWGKAIDENSSLLCLKSSDIIFCEWGLANAVWYSKKIKEFKSKKLFVRVHAQEVRPKAAKLAKQIEFDKVEKFIFVSEDIREKAINLFKWPVEKTEVIPNFVLDKEFIFNDNKFNHDILRIGMVGIIPEQKRFDRAISLLEVLLKNDINAHLYIKGQRPELLDWMLQGDRLKELNYYYNVYKRLNTNKVLRERVHFEGWGNNVAKFYEKIDVVLSPSENESFHYALADGVLSGCLPVVWPWVGANRIYSEDWVVKNESEASQRIMKFMSIDAGCKKKVLLSNREMIVEKYGEKSIFSKLNNLILGV